MFLYMHISLFKYGGVHDLEKYIISSCSRLKYGCSHELFQQDTLTGKKKEKKKKNYLTSCIPLLAAILIIIGLMILVIIDINFYRSVLESFP